MSDWHVIAVEGREGDLRAFVSGFLADRQADPTRVVFGDDVGLEHESLHARLRALLKGGHHAVLAPDELAGPLVDAVARGGGNLGLRVVDRHPVASASFALAAEVFSRDVATDIRAALGNLPAGVHFTQHSEQEEEHREEHRGVDLYAPVHRYAYRVRGTLVGPLAGILDVRRRLGDIEAVRLEPLQLA
jgi:hypothetical protein